MLGKSRNIVFFPMICGSRGSKSRLAKAAGAEPCGETRNEKVHGVVARKHISKSKCAKHTRSGPLLEVWMWKSGTLLWHQAHFYSSQNVKKKLPVSDHFCRATFGSSDAKNGMPLWREADFQVKMQKT